jgi:peroxiredoxin Q/BCP
MKAKLSLLAAALLLSACDHDNNPPAPATTSNATATATAASTAAAATTATPSTAATPAATTPGPAAALDVGSPAPDFTATATDGAPLHLAALKGKSVVVYFYPKDETEGCTKEACSFRDAWDSLSKTGVVLIGVSGDTDDSHRAFAEHHKLPFHLVSDSSGAIAALYGVPVRNGYAARQSFVIGPDGNLKKIYRHVDVTVHAAEIAKDLKP